MKVGAHTIAMLHATRHGAYIGATCEIKGLDSMAALSKSLLERGLATTNADGFYTLTTAGEIELLKDNAKNEDEA